MEVLAHPVLLSYMLPAELSIDCEDFAMSVIFGHHDQYLWFILFILWPCAPCWDISFTNSIGH